MAANAHAKRITNSITNPSQYWFDNYERVQGNFYGLEMYTVTGINPKTGKPANQDLDDAYIYWTESGIAQLIIICHKGIRPFCSMRYSLEPKARVYVKIRFSKDYLPLWKEISEASNSLLLGFELKRAANRFADQGQLLAKID